MKRAIISGATGAIGIALTEFLIEKEVEVLILTREESRRNSAIPKHPLVSIRYIDLADYADAIAGEDKYDVFYHFAWMGTTGAARNDMELQNANVRYALDAIRLAKRYGCHTFIGAGSQAEYGRSNVALTPDTPVHPENGYGMAKLCAGQMTRVLANELGIKHIWTRILSVFGAHDGKQSMMSMLFSCLPRGEKPALTAGGQIWDFLYEKDAANAFYLLGEKGKDKKTYVIGSGEARTLREYIKSVRDIIAPEASLGFGEIPYTENTVMYLNADVSDLCEDTGWKPNYTFEQAIQEMWKYYNAQADEKTTK